MKLPKLKPGETKTYYANPFYNEILVFLDNVPTSQEKYRPIDLERNLYELYSKDNVIQFSKSIKERLIENKKDWWPYQDYMSLTIVITGPKNVILKKDIDNFLKTIFDTLKGIVFDEDFKVISVLAQKEINSYISGFSVGIKLRKSEFFKDECIPFLWAGNTEKWADEIEIKKKNGEIYSFDFY